MATRRSTVSRQAPLPSWRKDRPSYWAVARFGDLPMQAKELDGLTRAGREVFWSSLERPDFSYADVQTALASDAAAVERFRQADPRGAQAIEPFLDLWPRCLGRWDALAAARACERVGDVLAPRGVPQQDLRRLAIHLRAGRAVGA